MKREPNIQSIRFSDELAELVEQRRGTAQKESLAN